MTGDRGKVRLKQEIHDVAGNDGDQRLEKIHLSWF
jgi:hypothetical protein